MKKYANYCIIQYLYTCNQCESADNLSNLRHNKKKNKRITFRLYSFDIILFLLIILITCSCTRTDSAVQETKEYPSMMQNNYEHFIYKNQKKYLHATIEKAIFYEKSERIECDNINAEIHNTKGELTTKIYSKKANVDEKNKKIIFSENVVVELLEHKTKLYSNELELDYKNNTMISKNDILMEKEDGSFLKASSMESDINSEVTTFKNMVSKYYYDEEEEEKK